MAQSPLKAAIQQITEEKNIPYDSVIETIEAALAVAYRKDFGEKNQNVKAEFNPEDGTARVFDVKAVATDELYEQYLKEQAEREAQAAAAAEAGESKPTPPEPSGPPPGTPTEPPAEAEEEHFDPKTMIALTQARQQKPDAEVGEEIRTELWPSAAYGRMAAQTAKQVIIQRLREAERDTIFKEFKGREGEILTGTVQRVEGRLVFVDLGHSTAIIPPPEQVSSERYQPGQRIKVYLVSVNTTPKGPEIVISRSHPEMVRKLFAIEVPEISAGSVEIKAIAREAGSRTKIAVFSNQKNIDPVGSCVGQRGTRVQTVIGELGGEKIDIVEWSDDPVKFISNALSPAKILSIKVNPEAQSAIAEVRDDQMSLAIGRNGQNVRLAAKLTGWKIDIVGEGQNLEDRLREREAMAAAKSGEAGSGSAGESGAASTPKETVVTEAAVTSEPLEPAAQAAPAAKTETPAEVAAASAGDSTPSDPNASAAAEPEQKTEA